MEMVSAKRLFAEQELYLGKNVILSGWVRTVRMSKARGFIELNDGTCFKSVQIVFEEDIDNFQEAARINVGAAVTVSGMLAASPGSMQSFELKAGRIVIEGTSTPDYPLQKKRHSLEYLRTIAHLRPRTNTFSAVFRLRSLLAYAIHCFFQEKGFLYVHTPIITGNDAEGAGEMFRVTTLEEDAPPRDETGAIDYGKDFFGKKTSLTVSGQLEGEAYCLAFNKIYTFGPTFRAENSNTARHAAEFWMIEPEIAFAGLQDNMQLAEEMMKYLITYALEKASSELEFFNSYIDSTLLDRLKMVRDAQFGQVTYSEAIKLLEKAEVDFVFPVKWGNDLQTEHERYLSEQVFGKPVFVTDYPKDIKAFYMRQNEDGKTVAAMDLLVPGVGEIIGGSQREERLALLEGRIKEMGLCLEEYWWYLDLRRYGGTKHAGFGLGFERLLMYLSGMANIRDVIPFPRTVKNADF